MTGVLRRAFVAASVGWALALPIAAYAASHVRGSSLVYGCTAIVYAVGSVVCHQLPARSFHLWSRQMPVCARCTGIYVGAALMAVIASTRRAKAPRHTLEVAHGAGPSVAPGFRIRALRRTAVALAEAAGPARTLIAAATPSALTLVYEWTTGQLPANWIRALAGLPLGVVVAWIVAAGD